MSKGGEPDRETKKDKEEDGDRENREGEGASERVSE